LLSPFKIGSANNKPEINCELTLPVILYSPLFNLPFTINPSISAPFSFKQFVRSKIGLCKSLPLPLKVAFIPSAEITGSKNLKVEPLSLQSKIKSPLGLEYENSTPFLVRL
jgi:hypothetical protein